MQTAVELLGTTTSALSSIKLNCVVIRGVNDHELADFVRLQQQFPDTQVRFIEYMPFQDNGWKLDKCVTYQEMLQRLERQGIHLQPVPATDPHDTTKWYTTAESGMVGFITSMSDHFCGGCNRLRLAADGSLQVCLFGSGKRTSLREVVRAGGSYAELDVLVRSALAGKEASLGGHAHPEQLVHDTSRPMTLIGG
jgi:cyclic pyranopterin phosphate synthase